MNIEKFKCLIEKVEYYQFDKNKYSNLQYYSKMDVESYEDINGNYCEPEVFMAKLSADEKKQGKKRRRKKLIINVYLTEKQFQDKVFEQGDLIEIQKGKIAIGDSLPMVVRDLEKIKNYPPRMIKKDASNNNYRYVEMKVIPFKVSVGTDGWKMIEKGSKAFYFKISGSNIKFFVDTEKDLLNSADFQFYLDEDEVAELQSFDNEIREISFHSYKKIKIKKQGEIQILLDAEIEKHYIYISNMIKI